MRFKDYKEISDFIRELNVLANGFTCKNCHRKLFTSHIILYLQRDDNGFFVEQYGMRMKIYGKCCWCGADLSLEEMMQQAKKEVKGGD